MSKSDTMISTQDLLHLASGDHGTKGDANPKVILVGGRFTNSPTALSDLDHAVILMGERGEQIQQPGNRQFILDERTSASSSATGTNTTGLAGYADADVILDVSAAAGTSPTLDVFLDSRLDGTGYTNIAHFTQITGVGTRVAHMSKRQSAVELDGSADVGAGTVRAIGWADDLRVRTDYSGGTTSPVFDHRVTINLVG